MNKFSIIFINQLENNLLILNETKFLKCGIRFMKDSRYLLFFNNCILKKINKILRKHYYFEKKIIFNHITNLDF